MRDDFAVFILTHARAAEQKTYETLRAAGYSGDVYFLIDDEDPQKEKYQELFGESVLQFSKREIKRTFDTMTNQEDYRSVVYARNAAYGIARQLGKRFILTCDDDIYNIRIRLLHGHSLGAYKIHGIDKLFEAMCDLMEGSQMGLLGFSQDGLYIGGANDKYLQGYKNDVSQMFMVDGEKPVPFRGLLNEDLHVVLDAAEMGLAALSTTLVSISSPSRSTNQGGLHDLYEDNGPYTRAFYSVMAFPGCVKIKENKGDFQVTKEKNCMVPMILDERWKK